MTEATSLDRGGPPAGKKGRKYKVCYDHLRRSHFWLQLLPHPWALVRWVPRGVVSWSPLFSQAANNVMGSENPYRPDYAMGLPEADVPKLEAALEALYDRRMEWENAQWKEWNAWHALRNAVEQQDGT